jgi:phosphate acetyltransferase
MSSSLYISTTEPGSGKALIALGILEFALLKTPKVGFFRPIIPEIETDKKNEDIDLILSHFNLNQSYNSSFGLAYSEASKLIGNHDFDQVLEKIITKYKALEKQCDFLLCEGSDYLGESSAFEFDLNAEIARNLGCPVLILGNAYQNTLEDAITPVQIAWKRYGEMGCQVASIILNKVAPENIRAFNIALQDQFASDLLLATIPYDRKLSSPRVRDIVEQLGAEVLYGSDHLDSLASSYIVAAMQVQHALPYLQEDSVAITPGDRADIIIGTLQAHQSANYPHLAGILLSGGFKPEPAIARLLEGLPDSLPILAVTTDTYTTAAALQNVRASLTAADSQKIALSIQRFQENVNLERLAERIRTIQVRGITPKMFTYTLRQQAKADRQRIVLPEGEEPRILQAAAALLAEEIVDITLLGRRDKIEQAIKKYGISLDSDRLTTINPADSDKLEEYAQIFYQLRQHKGVTPEVARDCLLDVSYFGTMMVARGDADGMVSGSIHTTGHTIRPALQIIKTKPGFSLVSSVFFMCLPERVLVYGDCAVNPNPTAEQLAEIAISSAETAQTFGVEPRVALLSYSSGESGQGADVEKVRQAVQIARQLRPDLQLEGPIQYDAAVDPAVAAQKLPASAVAGQATVFVFPDLNTGNNTYKAVQRETGAIAIGPVLQGLKKPVNDLSRGCTVEDIINTVAITAIQGQRNYEL